MPPLIGGEGGQERQVILPLAALFLDKSQLYTGVDKDDRDVDSLPDCELALHLRRWHTSASECGVDP